MPNLMNELAATSELTGGSFDIEPGAYKLRITKVKPHKAEEYFEIFWDVADGPSKGAYAQSQYPPSERIYWRKTTLGFLKMKLHRLALCNPGRFHVLNDAKGNFASLQEFEDDNWDAFEGAFVAAVVRRRLYTAGPNSKQPGADRTSIEIARWLSPDEFKTESWPKSLLNDNDQRDKSLARQNADEPITPPAQAYQHDDLYDEDVPF